MIKLLDIILSTFITGKHKIPMIRSFKEINNLLKSKNSRKYEYLYHNKKTIHKILYDNEKIIKILPFDIENNISNLFYLTLLIKDDPCSTNYIYSFEYIDIVNNYRKNKNNVLTCFILSMIILELIDNYKNSEDFYEDIHENKLNAIYEENKQIRDNFINTNNNYYDLNKNQITSNNIEAIYSKIVISIISKEKLIDYEFSKNIFNQLGFDNINITEKFFQNLFAIFNNNNTFIKKYAITNVNDLYDEQKIGFYYIIFKSIFKNSIYIYKIPFLLKSRNTILKIIKNEKDENSKIHNKNIRLQKVFIIKTLCDSSYYFLKYLGKKYEQLKEVFKFYQFIFFESKKEEINNLQLFIKDLKTDIDYESYLEDFENAKHLNKRIPIIKLLLQKDNENSLNEIKMNEIIQKWEIIEKYINDKKVKKMIKNDKKLLNKIFNDQNNKDILLKIFKEEIYEYFIRETNRNITDESKGNNFYESLSSEFDFEVKEYHSTDDSSEKKTKNESEKEKEKEKQQEKQQESQSLIKEVTDNSNYSENSKNKKLSYKENYTVKYDSEEQNEVNFYNELDYEFLSYDKVIGVHENVAEFITELRNGYFISGGDKHLLIYNQNYYQVMDIENKKVISNITEVKTEIKTEKTKNEIQIIVCSKDSMHLIALNTEKDDYKIKKYILPFMPTYACLEIKKNSHIILGEQKVYHGSDLYSKIISSKMNIIINGSYKGVIKLNRNMFALTSNKVLKHGENILNFYNSNSQRVIKKIKGYSFIASNKGLFLMSKEEEKNKILLCACKKYDSTHKNGILLVNSYIDEFSIDIKNKIFYNTSNFEVHCFCPILKRKKTDYIKIFTDENDIEETDYFLVGGYDTIKCQGKIKLYKIIRNEKVENTKIDFIQDINIGKTKKFNGFQSPINCIAQSKRNFKICLSCLDGKIHVLSTPNIDTFLEYDEKTKYDFKISFMKKRRKEIIVGVE